MKTIMDFARARAEAQPIVMVTAYDALMARIVASSQTDVILVGDSAAMVVHGLPPTVDATLEMMCLHTAAVWRGAPKHVIVADMAFGSFRRGRHFAAEAAGALMQAGATAVKLEGVAGLEKMITHLVSGGIPVMGHLGLTPQSVNQLGGYRVQGRSAEESERLRREAGQLEALGAFVVVLECVTEELAKTVTEERTIPTIGIGAEPETAGQVLMITDLLGLDAGSRPKFARRYLDGHRAVLEALNDYARDVRTARFPATEEILA